MMTLQWLCITSVILSTSIQPDPIHDNRQDAKIQREEQITYGLF